jgi:hypothetical protein
MTKVLGKKIVGGVDFLDLLGAGAVKYFEERALSGIIGNGSLKSGVIKLGIGMVARKFLPRGILGDSVALGFSVDGVEDILVNVLGGFGQTSGGEAW